MSNYKVAAFAITIQSPIHKSFLSFGNKNIHYWEEKFTYLKDGETNPTYKKNYDRCYVLLKVATTYSGKLTNVSNCHEGISFTFEFERFDDLINFNKKIKTL